MSQDCVPGVLERPHEPQGHTPGQAMARERKMVSAVFSEIRSRSMLLFYGYSYTQSSSSSVEDMDKGVRRGKFRRQKIKNPKPVSKKVNHGLATPNGYVSTGPYYSGSKINGLPVKPEMGWLLPPQEVSNMGKRTLVLDLDETLVHVSDVDNGGNYDFIIYMNTILNKATVVTEAEIAEKKLENNLSKQIFYVKRRPGLSKFLKILSKSYELIIFTASMQGYADTIIDQIDKNTLINHRLYRQHCTVFNGMRVKDLSRLGRPLCDVILLDNSPDSGFFQPNNHIIISDFYDDDTDRELFRYVGLLEKIKEKRSIFSIISRFNTHIMDEVSNASFLQSPLSSPTIPSITLSLSLSNPASPLNAPMNFWEV